MEELISSVIRGIPIGCVFALLAVGLVLTYKTSGVFNLAFGAQAFVSAAVFYDTHVRHEWEIIPAFVLAVLVIGPISGLVLDRLLFRYLRTAPPIARLVTSLGLLVAIPSIVKLWFGTSAAFGPPSIAPNATEIYRFGDYAIDGNQLATIVITVVVVVALMLMFRYTPIGLQMRAVVESPRMTQLAGINADRVGAFSWVLSSVFAGLAGVLLAPLFAQVSDQNYFVLLIATIAAAAFGSLNSIPMAFAGGLLLGVLQQILAAYLPANSILSAGLRPSLPFVALFLLLLFWPGLRDRRETTDPLAGVDPPPPALAAQERSTLLTRATWGAGIVATLVVFGLVFFVVDDFWLLILTQAVIFSVVFLSIVVITGMAGQVSLCQATFAACGAFATGQLVQRYDLPVITTMIVGALIAAAVGALLAIPALRLGGIFLSLATLAFAFFFEYVLVPIEWIGGGTFPVEVPRPVVGPFDLADDKAFFVFCVVVLAIVGTLVVFIRHGTTGRTLDALRGSEVAAASIGINATRARITAFALSAGIAGLGGGLLAIQQGFANYQANFTVFFGLFWVVIVVSLGSRTVEGAIQAGIGFMLFPELLKALGIPLEWQYIFFGLGAIGFAKHPEGVLEFQKRMSLGWVQRQLDRRKQGGGGAAGAGPAAPGEGAVPVPAAPAGSGAARVAAAPVAPSAVAPVSPPAPGAPDPERVQP